MHTDARARYSNFGSQVDPQGNPPASPQQVRDGLFVLAAKHIVTDARSANDDLLFRELLRICRPRPGG